MELRSKSWLLATVCMVTVCAAVAVWFIIFRAGGDTQLHCGIMDYTIPTRKMTDAIANRCTAADAADKKYEDYKKLYALVNVKCERSDGRPAYGQNLDPRLVPTYNALCTQYRSNEDALYAQLKAAHDITTQTAILQAIQNNNMHGPLSDPQLFAQQHAYMEAWNAVNRERLNAQNAATRAIVAAGGHNVKP